MDDTWMPFQTKYMNLALKKGTPVAIFSNNRPEWVIADLAILKLGGIVVPIYHTLPAGLVKYIINDFKTELLFVENAQLLSLVKKVRNEMSSLKNIVVLIIPVWLAKKNF